MFYGWSSVTVCIISLLLVVVGITSLKIDKVCRGCQVVLGCPAIILILSSERSDHPAPVTLPVSPQTIDNIGNIGNIEDI